MSAYILYMYHNKCVSKRAIKFIVQTEARPTIWIRFKLKHKQLL